MIHFKKKIAVLLAVCMTANAIPVTASAEESAGKQEIMADSAGEENAGSEESAGKLKITSDTTEEKSVSSEESVESTEYEEQIILELSLLAEGTSSGLFADSFRTVLSSAGYIPDEIIHEAEDGTVTLTVQEGQGKILELLSLQPQTAEANYQNWNIDFSFTGNLILGDTYKGLGDDDFPFLGKFTGQSITVKSSRTIFKALGAQADLNNVRINWTGTQDTPVLAYKLVAGDTDCEIHMPLASSSNFSPYIGKLTGGTGLVTLPSLDYSAVKAGPSVEYSGDVGLVCGEMDDGTVLQVGTLTLPGNVSLNLAGSENVGSLVGSMKEGSRLTVSGNLDLDVTLKGNNTGGLVGSMVNSSICFSEGAIASVSADLTAGQSAGGIAGIVVTGTGPLNENASVIFQSVKVKATENAGVYYGTCTVTGTFAPLAGVSFADDAQKEVSGPGSCGGMFGALILNENGICRLNTESNTDSEISSSLTAATNTTAYGGVAGTLEGAGAKNALVVKKCNITSKISVGTDTTYYPQYIGGIVALQKTATLDAANSTITVQDPKTKAETDRGFGGLSAYVGDGALLIADTMAVNTSSYSTNKGGGSVAGSAHRGSIICLKNSLDLSGCPLLTNAYSGQIVGSQDCSLVYAPGVAITRYSGGMELDDIGNYGELYRIADFLQVGDDYAVSFSRILNKTGDTYQLSDALDYACLALAWQARGYFPTVDGVDSDSWSTLKTATLILNQDLDLTGCGIGGLTRDVNSAEDTFSGELIGNGYKISLDIGGENQADHAKVSKGDGRIYWHYATGLFAVLSGSAKVQNLTLAGSIRVSNNKLTSASTSMKSGGLAALLSCDTASADTITGVSTEVAVDVVCSGSNPLYVGGVFGLISGTKQTTLNFTSGTNLASDITVSNSGNGHYNHIGGAAGAIEKDSSVNMVCDGAKLGGKIEYKNASNNIYAGGLVGTIFPGGSGIRTISITDLTVDQFSLTGTASERMGGILGGIWANTDVTVGGLKVTGTMLDARGNGELGGLVYRASGKWSVSSADLSGLSINAAQAKALGLLVCQGGPYKELINAKDTEMNGLYLVVEEYWDWNEDTGKGYRVPAQIEFDGSVFDEFVAYTAWADRNSGTPDYQITANGSGIISLKTENGTVNMTEGERNTYVNRTTVGQSMQTNLYSRYYYNLPEVMNACSGSDTVINTAEELLIWSVYRYAASNLKAYFTAGNADITAGTVGGTSSADRASFDMKGLSYYPIDITNSSAAVQYADVKFYNDQIETKEAGNKLTRGDAGSHSQHYTMHCALFGNFTADLTAATDYTDRTLTVNGVSFSGSVGTVNGGSGALICGTVQGDTRGGNSSACTVILGDADETEKAVLLDGMYVAPAGDFTPVLICRSGSYAGIRANYISTTDAQTMEAGSSLIGDVGGQGATGVSVEFAGTIRLPESGVFTRAIIFNSLRYENGSATYHFYKSKDYDGDTHVHNVTYGKELSTTVEYKSKQGCYYDAYGEGYFVSAVGRFDEQNDFSNYLPYVAFSPATSASEYSLADGWHELAVNVLSLDLTEGCGTYGHPYRVDKNLLIEVANYINRGTPSIGWKVRVSTDEEYHTDEAAHDEILTYTESGWQREDQTTYTGNVQQYLADAYFEITESMELADFKGIGTDGSDQGLPFTGVITGGADDITVTLSGGSTAFIKYSYGSVVRDLTIVLKQSSTLNRNTWTRGTAEQSPKTFFGGVIGCVLGGDNIIENVTVRAEEPFRVEPAGTGPHLVPVGGYVGVIAGGGVIFRGSCSNDTGITGTDAQIYRNPIIGRVLGGYAFYEGTETVPDNGDKNYKINQISYDGTSDLTWDESTTTLTVNNAQGLLLLSAIVSSGGGSKSSNAYAKGRARNASYNQIGAAAESDDYEAAKKDSRSVWTDSNVPYLLDKYTDDIGSAELCSSGTDGIVIRFAENGSFDMDGYGNGYRGLSARYVSNAAFGETNGVSSVEVSRVVLRVSAFDGRDTDVQNISMNVREYEDDDFHAASLGGIFNIVWTKKQSGGTSGSIFAQNLTLTDCNVSLKYIGSDGTEKIQPKTDTFADEDGLSAVTVGGLIGSVSDIDATDTTRRSLVHNYLLQNLHIKGGEITGPTSAGGLIGATAMTNDTVKGCPGILLSGSKYAMFGPSFLNCSYSGITVTAKLAAGGLAGYVYAYSSSNKPQFSGLGIPYKNGSVYFNCFASCTVTEEALIVGRESTITAETKGGVAGGIFGAVGMRIGINDPEVNDRTGLSVADDTGIRTLRLNKVTVQASVKDELIRQSSGSINGPDGSADNSSAAGILGRIGNVNPTYFYDISLMDCTVKSGEKANGAYAGGIVAYGYTNTSIVIQKSEIVSTAIISKISGGYVGYGYSASDFNLNMSDCRIENSTINGSTYSGGLVGKAASQYYLFNILLKNTSITGSKAGRLFGWMNINATGDDFKVNAAGISVYADKGEVSIPEAVGNKDAGKNYNGFISYADYAGTETEVSDQKAPYVTVNPNFRLSGVDKLLTGDAVGKITGDTYGSVAARIWTDNITGTETDGKKNLVSYPRAAEIVNEEGKSEPVVSTFLLEQGCGPEELPVLVLRGANSGMIEAYLNVITNGGYSEANVKPEISVYYYDTVDGTFARATDAQLKAEPASIYLASDNRTLRVRNNSFDNTRNRFTLIEASFTVKVNGVNRTCTVSVPVVVIRELQYNFMSTFSYGAEFRASTYDTLKTHVLESTENPITAYITYQYNREKSEYVEYDWQGHMDTGGDMRNVDKILSFSSGLPSGTQLLLVDCQDGNRAYQYRTQGTSAGTKTDIRLRDFTSVSDQNENFTSSMADILGVTLSQNDANGKYLEETDLSKATVCLDNKYYRPVGDGETVAEGTMRYDLTVPDLEAEENIPEENYYLVINVPKQNESFYINGALSSSLEWIMPNSGTWVHRYDNTLECRGSNDESTYQISAGYRQELVTVSAPDSVDLSDEKNKMRVQIRDEITFSNEQVYGDSDSLFLKFSVDMQEHTKQEDNSESVQELGFPSGTTGTVHFFVQDEQGNYYTYNGSSWAKQDKTKAEASSCTWTSHGANMELLLSQDGNQALDLAGVRKIIKGQSSAGESKIIVTAEMDVVFGGQGMVNEIIPPSENSGVDRWVQLQYTARISTQEASLRYSTVSVFRDDNIKYYRGVQYAAILAMDATNISQLGINPLELVQ